MSRNLWLKLRGYELLMDFWVVGCFDLATRSDMRTLECKPGILLEVAIFAKTRVWQEVNIDAS